MNKPFGKHTDDGWMMFRLLETKDDIPSGCCIAGCAKTNFHIDGNVKVSPLIRVRTAHSGNVAHITDMCIEHFENLVVDGNLFLRDLRREFTAREEREKSDGE